MFVFLQSRGSIDHRGGIRNPSVVFKGAESPLRLGEKRPRLGQPNEPRRVQHITGGGGSFIAECCFLASRYSRVQFPEIFTGKLSIGNVLDSVPLINPNCFISFTAYSSIVFKGRVPIDISLALNSSSSFAKAKAIFPSGDLPFIYFANHLATSGTHHRKQRQIFSYFCASTVFFDYSYKHFRIGRSGKKCCVNKAQFCFAERNCWLRFEFEANRFCAV